MAYPLWHHSAGSGACYLPKMVSVPFVAQPTGKEVIQVKHSRTSNFSYPEVASLAMPARNGAMKS
jgi:hypothetical protein